MTDIFICQRKYAAKILNRFDIEKYNSVCNPIIRRQKIGQNENDTKVDITLYK